MKSIMKEVKKMKKREKETLITWDLQCTKPILNTGSCKTDVITSYTMRPVIFIV